MGLNYSYLLYFKDIASGVCLRTLYGHDDFVQQVAVAGDGRCGVSASYDRTLRMWDVSAASTEGAAGGACIAIFLAERRMECVGFSPDGLTVAAGDSKGDVFFLRLENITIAPAILTVWQAPHGGPLALGCPHCRTWSEIDKTALGTELPCPNCGKAIKLNPFVVDADWRPVVEAWKGKL